MKYLIINADDFGMSYVFNNSILEYLEKGMITSTTVMVNRINELKQADQIKQLIKIRNNKNISIGLHYELGQGSVKDDFHQQYNKFKTIFGFDPSHIDIHKMQTDDFYDQYFDIIKILNLKTRGAMKIEGRKNRTLDGIVTTDFPPYNGTKIEKAELDNFAKQLQDNKTHEILFHPGTYDEDATTSLNKKRELDIEKIEYLNTILGKYDIKLISFNNI